jgi:uncharacterized membrane protein YoaT (DUF817 family)
MSDVERGLESRWRRLLAATPTRGPVSRLVEFLALGLKQGAVVVLFGRTWMHYRVFRRTLRMPVLAAFLLVALFIWFAENIATFSEAWSYPDQEAGWQLVSLAKLGSWFLLMIISVVLVTWVYPPKAPRVGSVGG